MTRAELAQEQQRLAAERLGIRGCGKTVHCGSCYFTDCGCPEHGYTWYCKKCFDKLRISNVNGTWKKK